MCVGLSIIRLICCNPFATHPHSNKTSFELQAPKTLKTLERIPSNDTSMSLELVSEIVNLNYDIHVVDGMTQ